MSVPRVWVIGRSGLLGSALARVHPAAHRFAGSDIPWADPAVAVRALAGDLRRFRDELPPGADWTIYWAAGAGAIGSDPERFRQESSVLAGFLDALSGSPPPPRGAFFFSSSASVYGGSKSLVIRSWEL